MKALMKRSRVSLGIGFVSSVLAAGLACTSSTSPTTPAADAGGGSSGGSSGSSSGSSSGGSCTPPSGTYELLYISESDSGLCQAPASATIVLQPDAGPPSDAGATDSGLACTTASDCTTTCSGNVEGLLITETTTLTVSAAGYAGTNTQVETYEDGGVISSCSYDYTATLE